MEITEFSELLEKSLRELNIKISEKQINQFFNYMNLLLEWNEKINLTAITKQDEIILKHFVDSLTVLKFVQNDKKIIDVGTGAGFPGIPLNILNNKVEITLLDSLNKRIIFLNDVINKLKLKNILTTHSRVEDYAKINRESYDIAISRAVAPLNVLLEYLMPLIKINGICICMKGSNIEDEISQSNKALSELGGKIERIKKIILPGTNIVRNIIIVKKIKETSKKYPRKPGIASKMPIV